MTREEAIKYLKNADITVGCKVKTKTAEAIEMAIEALEQEPCEDVLSRAEVKKIAKEMYLEVANMKFDVSTISDCISYTSSKCREVFERKLQELTSSVTPQEPKTGHWIYDNFNWRCSECNETPKTMGYVGTAAFMTEHFKFCNHCGAKMVEPQESEKE